MRLRVVPVSECCCDSKMSNIGVAQDPHSARPGVSLAIVSYLNKGMLVRMGMVGLGGMGTVERRGTHE